jgi:DNA helicase II / ATP-dependent DNA helicase PcrA
MMTKPDQKLQIKYDTAFDMLNQAQKKAVTQIEGPVMTIAGPGTGKTQLLAMRVGYILKNTDVYPHNILCLTYTDAASVEMRNRLLEFIGPDAYQVNIFTFHGFCNQVIQENMGDFGDYRDLQQITDLEEIELLRKLIDGFSVDHPLKRFKADVYFEVPKLKNLFGLMKQEGWTYETIKNAYDSFAASISDPDNPHPDYVYQRKTKVKDTTFLAGDLKAIKIEDDLKKYKVIVDAAAEFENFQSLMKSNERYDYHDMILWVIRRFMEKDVLLGRYQEKYQYILVDEYQDTNGAQNQLLFLLASYWEKPNVFIVGDDDQSIFRFQGANMSSIEDFVRQFEPNIVVLEENYRSTQTILDLSKSLIQHNQKRLINQFEGLTKNLIASHPDKKELFVEPEILKFENYTQEEIGIIQKIKELAASGVPYNKMAVLYPMHKIAENIIEYCQKEKIPVQVKRSVNVLTQPLILKLLTLLQYVYEESKETHSGEFLIFQILHFDFLGLHPKDIGKIALYCRSGSPMSMEDDEIVLDYPKWREVITNPKILEEAGVEHINEVLEKAALLESWISDYFNVTIQLLIQKVITESGILHRILTGADSGFNMQLLNSFFDLVKEECARTERFGVREMLEMVKKMEQNRLRLNVNKIVTEEDGVQFMSTHGAKGLEFDYVFIIRNNQTSWEKKRGGNQNYAFPPNLISDSKIVELEDLRRLFYVALTRAKIKLFMSYVVRDDKNKDEVPTQFLSEIFNDLPEKTLLKIPEDEILKYKGILMLYNPEIKNLISTSDLNRILENFSISATSLNKYLECPVTFYYEKILRIPMGRNATMGYGNAIHYALEMFFRDIELASPRSLGSVSKLLAFFEKGMKKYHSHFTKAEMERYSYHGKEVLTSYFATYSKHWLEPKKYEIEYSIKNVEHSGVPISGKLDKISFYDGKLLVTDYKTGSFKKEKLKAYDQEKDGKVGDYWRQLVFYSLLMDADKRNNWRLEEAYMDFVEKNKAGEYDTAKLNISAQDKEYVSEELKMVYEKIKNHEFSVGCGKAECGWCNFVTKNAPLKLNFAEDEEF